MPEDIGGGMVLCVDGEVMPRETWEAQQRIEVFLATQRAEILSGEFERKRREARPSWSKHGPIDIATLTCVTCGLTEVEFYHQPRHCDRRQPTPLAAPLFQGVRTGMNVYQNVYPTNDTKGPQVPPPAHSPIDGALCEQRNLLDQALRQIRALTIRLEPVLDCGTIQTAQRADNDSRPEPPTVYSRLSYSNDQARELMNLMNAINERLQL